MFHIKHNDTLVPFTLNLLYHTCPDCGKETEIDICAVLKKHPDFDFFHEEMLCDECAGKARQAPERVPLPEDVKNALQTVQTFCERHGDCETCPLEPKVDCHTDCMLPPYAWCMDLEAAREPLNRLKEE